MILPRCRAAWPEVTSHLNPIWLRPQLIRYPLSAMSTTTTVSRVVTLADGSKVPALAFGTGQPLFLY